MSVWIATLYPREDGVLIIAAPTEEDARQIMLSTLGLSPLDGGILQLPAVHSYVTGIIQYGNYPVGHPQATPIPRRAYPFKQ